MTNQDHLAPTGKSHSPARTSGATLKTLALGFIALFVVVNAVIAVVAFVSSRDRDLSVPERAIEFVEGVYGGNYEAMWELSSAEYRAGRSRDEFITWARENTPPVTRIFDWTVLNETSGDTARAHTRIQLASGDIETHRLIMHRSGDEWLVSEFAPYDGPWPPEEPPLEGP